MFKKSQFSERFKDYEWRLLQDRVLWRELGYCYGKSLVEGVVHGTNIGLFFAKSASGIPKVRRR